MPQSKIVGDKTKMNKGAGVGLPPAVSCWRADIEPSAVCSGVVFTQTIKYDCNDPYAAEWTYTKQLTGTRGPARIIKGIHPSTISCGQPFERTNVPVYDPPCPGPGMFKTTEFGTSGCSKCEVEFVSAHGPHEAEYVYIQNSVPCHTPTPTPKPTPTPYCWTTFGMDDKPTRDAWQKTACPDEVQTYGKEWNDAVPWCAENKPPPPVQTKFEYLVKGRCAPRYGRISQNRNEVANFEDYHAYQEDTSKCNCPRKWEHSKCGGTKGRKPLETALNLPLGHRCRDFKTKWDDNLGDWVNP